VSRHLPPRLQEGLTPVERDGESLWVSADGEWVVLSRRSLARLMGDETGERAAPPMPVELGPELGLLLKPRAGARLGAHDETTEEVPTVVVVDPAKVELPRAEASVPSLVSRASGPVQPSVIGPVAAPVRSPARVVIWGIVGLSVVLLLVAGGVMLGTELARRPALPQQASPLAVVQQPSHTMLEARPSSEATAQVDTRPAERPVPAPATPEPQAPAVRTSRATPVAQAPAAPVAAAVVATPTPRVSPAPASPAAWQQHLAAGWKVVERDPRAAGEHFREALTDRPSNADAHYGYGYALLKQGKSGEATRHLCIARSTDESIRREISGLMSEHGLSCD
jgi:hypothetical protein